jgi:hypothetical protein
LSSGSPDSTLSLPLPGHRSFVSIVRDAPVMAGQRPPSAGVPAATARPPAPGQQGGSAAASARPPAQSSSLFPSMMGGQQGTSVPPFPQPFMPVAPRALQLLQLPSR